VRKRKQKLPKNGGDVLNDEVPGAARPRGAHVEYSQYVYIYGAGSYGRSICLNLEEAQDIRDQLNNLKELPPTAASQLYYTREEAIETFGCKCE
jgi:hypothetical protein